MPAFDTEQTAEIAALVRSTLGLEGEKTLAELIADGVNGPLNSFDKRIKKERSDAATELSTTLEGITSALTELREGGGGGGGGGGGDDFDPEHPDLSKLPKGVQAHFAKQTAAMKKLEQSLQTEKEAREGEASKRQEAEAAQAQRDLREAIRASALDSENLGFEFDPAMLDILVGHHEATVRRVEGGEGYEINTGPDPITSDPVYKPLAEGLKGFGATTLGKRFQKAVGGGGTPPPPGTPPGPGGAGHVFTADEIANMKPSDLAKDIESGAIKFQGT